jgi:hypothetical protein
MVPYSCLQVGWQGDISGGLLVNNSEWHFFTSCTSGWCHLSSSDLCHWQSHGVIAAKESPSYPQPLRLGTGSILPSPANDGSILAWVNNQAAHMVSKDGMKTWTAVVRADCSAMSVREPYEKGAAFIVQGVLPSIWHVDLVTHPNALHPNTHPPHPTAG